MKHWILKKGSKLPLYRQLALALMQDIRRGIYQAGDSLPSISELDAKLKLGRVTIVNSFRELVRTGHAVAQHGRGHFVAELGNRMQIGIILPTDQPDELPRHATLVTAIQAEAESRQQRVLLRMPSHDPDQFAAAADDLIIGERCRQLVVILPLQARTGRVSMTCLRHLLRRRRKLERLVIVDRETPAKKSPFPQICPDRAQGEELLLERARVTGARRVVFLNEEEDPVRNPERLTQLATQGGLSVAFLVATNALADLAQIREGGYDAVLCGNDLMARRLTLLLTDQAEFRLAGYGASPMATAMSPRLTTVDPDLTTMGRMAYAALIQPGPFEPTLRLVAPTLVPGETL